MARRPGWSDATDVISRRDVLDANSIRQPKSDVSDFSNTWPNSGKPGSAAEAGIQPGEGNTFSPGFPLSRQRTDESARTKHGLIRRCLDDLGNPLDDLGRCLLRGLDQGLQLLAGAQRYVESH